MNKFTYLLLLLFCMMGGVMNAQGIVGFTKAAETKTLPANLTTGYYLIKEVNPQATGKPGGYLKAASEAADAVVTPKGINTDYDGSNALELWYIEVDGETFTIATANKKAAWQAPNLNQKNLVAYANKANLTKTTESVTLGNKTATPTDGSCIIQNSGKTSCIHYSGNNLGSWTDANPASVMMFEFYEVKKEDLTKTSTAQVTYTYRLEGATKTYTKTIEQAVGENYEAPAFTEVDFVTFTQPQGTVQATGNNVDVTCTENLPFPKTTDLQSPKWVSINMHNYNSYGYKLFWTCEGPNQDIHAKKKEYNYELLKDNAYLWCIYGNAFDGFEIYNKNIGTDKSLNTTTGNAQITENTEHTKWFVVNSKADNGKPCFTADRKNYLNAQFVQGGDTDATLKTWSDADGGSTCRIFAPSDWVLTKAEKVASIPTGAVGGYTNDEVIDTPLTEYEKDLFNIPNAIALGDAIAQLTPNNVTLEANKYYRLQSKHYTTRYANADMTGAENMKKAISSVVLFEATETEAQYRLKMQGLGLGHATTSTPITLTSETNNMGSYKAVDKGEALFALKDATSSTAQYSALHDAASQSHKLVGWEENAEASQWYIIPATDVEVALNTAGDASYATTYLPFSVSNVEGATAYIGKVVKQENGNILQATAIKAGIPDNQGVILKGAANAEKAVLTLGKATSDVQNNALIGTFVEKDYTNELVFGVNNNVVGFYSMAAGKKIGANKAYLEAAARAMKLVFDGDVTGIENVMGEAADANAPIYDLTGRRVMKAVKGGLDIQNGKKFIAQ